MNFTFSNDWILLIQPILCVFGVIANGINILVLSNSKMKDQSFTYMLVISISDFFFVGLLAYVSFNACDDCPFNYSFYSQLYSIYIDDYFTSCLGVFALFCELAVSIQRTFILANKSYCQHFSNKLLILILFLISLFYYLHVLFFKEIIQINNNNNNSTEIIIYYQAVKNDLGKSEFGILYNVVITAFRIFLGTAVLSIINIINMIEFKQRINKNKHQILPPGKIKIKN
jgi:hypothetical protein